MVANDRLDPALVEHRLVDDRVADGVYQVKGWGGGEVGFGATALILLVVASWVAVPARGDLSRAQLVAFGVLSTALFLILLARCCTRVLWDHHRRQLTVLAFLGPARLRCSPEDVAGIAIDVSTSSRREGSRSLIIYFYRLVLVLRSGAIDSLSAWTPAENERWLAERGAMYADAMGVRWFSGGGAERLMRIRRDPSTGELVVDYLENTALNSLSLILSSPTWRALLLGAAALFVVMFASLVR